MSRYYKRVAERAGNRCEYCRAPEIVFNMQFEVDHILPRSRGGINSFDNPALSCPSATFSSRILKRVRTTPIRI
jgi:hypothetical protein